MTYAPLALHARPSGEIVLVLYPIVWSLVCTHNRMLFVRSLWNNKIRLESTLGLIIAPTAKQYSTSKAIVCCIMILFYSRWWKLPVKTELWSQDASGGGAGQGAQVPRSEGEVPRVGGRTPGCGTMSLQSLQRLSCQSWCPKCQLR